LGRHVVVPPPPAASPNGTGLEDEAGSKEVVDEVVVEGAASGSGSGLVGASLEVEGGGVDGGAMEVDGDAT